MITVTPSATIALKDTGISPNPNPVPFAGAGVTCPKGTIAQDVGLAAASSNVPIPAPTGVTTFKILAIYPSTAADLIVTVGGQNFPVPVNQPFFVYNRLVADVSVSSVLGGKFVCVVGG